MMDIVERLKEDAEYHRMVSYDADCSPEATINHKHHINALEAADEIERLREALKLIAAEPIHQCVSRLTNPPICDRAWIARSALQQKESK